jgi:hypothetical protein
MERKNENDAFQRSLRESGLRAASSLATVRRWAYLRIQGWGPMGAMVRRGVAITLCFLALVLGALAAIAVPSQAQQWDQPEPDHGPPGTSVQINGNLIGCYGSGPGLESSTWGFPDRVVFYWSSAVLTQDDAKAFGQRIAANPNDRAGLQEIASYSFGAAGWSLKFSIPEGSLGPHYGVLSFEPRCNYKSVAHPDGDDKDPANVVMSFCVTEKDGTCRSPLTSIEGGIGKDLGGGRSGTGHGTADFSVLDREIRRNYAIAFAGVVVAVVLGGVLISVASAGAAAASAASGTVTAAEAAEASYIQTLLGRKVAELSASEYGYLLKRGLIKIVEQAPRL